MAQADRNCHQTPEATMKGRNQLKEKQKKTMTEVEKTRNKEEKTKTMVTVKGERKEEIGQVKERKEKKRTEEKMKKEKIGGETREDQKKGKEMKKEKRIAVAAATPLPTARRKEKARMEKNVIDRVEILQMRGCRKSGEMTKENKSHTNTEMETKARQRKTMVVVGMMVKIERGVVVPEMKVVMAVERRVKGVK